MKFLLLLPALLAFLSATAHAHERWQNDARVLSCIPQTFREGETLTVKLSPNHGKELSVGRAHDKTTFLLVVGSPPEGFSSLMSTAEFSQAKQVLIPSTLEATPWEAPFNMPKVRVFNRTGTYWLFTSTNLESEAKGHRCKVKFVQGKK